MKKSILQITTDVIYEHPNFSTKEQQDEIMKRLMEQNQPTRPESEDNESKNPESSDI